MTSVAVDVISAVGTLLEDDHDLYEVRMQQMLIGRSVVETGVESMQVCSALLRMHGAVVGRAHGSFENGEPNTAQQLGLAVLVAAINGDEQGLIHAIRNAGPADVVTAIRVATHTTANMIHRALHHQDGAA